MTGETSRLDLGQMLGDIIAEFGGSGGKRIGVVASEPDSMGWLVRNTCAGMVCDGRNVDEVIEKFGR